MNREDINKVADWMMANGYATGHGETMEDLLDELKWQIEEQIAIEREACAKVCEERFAGSVTANDTLEAFNGAIKWCAASIRARGQG